MKASGGSRVSPSWGSWEGVEAPGVGEFPRVYGCGEEGNGEGGVPRLSCRPLGQMNVLALEFR